MTTILSPELSPYMYINDRKYGLSINYIVVVIHWIIYATIFMALLVWKSHDLLVLSHLIYVKCLCSINAAYKFVRQHPRGWLQHQIKSVDNPSCDYSKFVG